MSKKRNLPKSYAAKPIEHKKVGPQLWVFSFRYWRQIEYFGLAEAGDKWFVSFLEKLTDLSKEFVDKFRFDLPTQDYWRYHEIDWAKKNVPIRLEDLDWIDGSQDLDLMQFQISKALGRVVGFWDADEVFNIVLLDPLHNIQPSKDFSYKVDRTTVLPCLYSSLLDDIHKVKRERCISSSCRISDALKEVPRPDHQHMVTIVRLDDAVKADLNAALEMGLTMENIIKAGIDALSR